MPGLANARDLQMQDQHVAKVKNTGANKFIRIDLQEMINHV
jgi:hypothetical protein